MFSSKLFNKHNTCLTRLRLGLSHLNEHRFNHNFDIDSCSSPLCSCSLEVESTKHFFLQCCHYTNICKTLLNTVEMIDNDLNKILLFGNCKFSLKPKFVYNQSLNQLH